MAFCSNCGSNINDNDKFCPACGAEQKSAGSEQYQSSQSSQSHYNPSGYSSQQYSKPKKLYRSHNNKVIAGVCGGLGNYLNIDPVLVRIGFILISLLYGSGLLLYIILALVVEEDMNS